MSDDNETELTKLVTGSTLNTTEKQSGKKRKKKRKKKICMTITFIPFLLIAFTLLLTFIWVRVPHNNCSAVTKLNVVSVFPRDTVLGFEVNENPPCSYNAGIHTSSSIEIFTPKCKSLYIRSESITTTHTCYKMYSAIILLDTNNNCQYSNYFLKGSVMNITTMTTVISHVYACVFTEYSDYQTFSTTEDENELDLIVDRNFNTCVKFVDDFTHTLALTINENGYYYSAIRTRDPLYLPNVQFTFNAARKYYNHSDYKSKCSAVTDKCKLSLENGTCVLVYASHSESNKFTDTIVFSLSHVNTWNKIILTVVTVIVTLSFVAYFLYNTLQQSHCGCMAA